MTAEAAEPPKVAPRRLQWYRGLSTVELGGNGPFDAATMHRVTYGPAPQGYTSPKRLLRGTVNKMESQVAIASGGSSPVMWKTTGRLEPPGTLPPKVELPIRSGSTVPLGPNTPQSLAGGHWSSQTRAAHALTARQSPPRTVNVEQRYGTRPILGAGKLSAPVTVSPEKLQLHMPQVSKTTQTAATQAVDQTAAPGDGFADPSEVVDSWLRRGSSGRPGDAATTPRVLPAGGDSSGESTPGRASPVEDRQAYLARLLRRGNKHLTFPNITGNVRPGISPVEDEPTDPQERFRTTARSDYRGLPGLGPAGKRRDMSDPHYRDSLWEVGRHEPLTSQGFSTTHKIVYRPHRPEDSPKRAARGLVDKGHSVVVLRDPSDVVEAVGNDKSTYNRMYTQFPPVPPKTRFIPGHYSTTSHFTLAAEDPRKKLELSGQDLVKMVRRVSGNKGKKGPSGEGSPKAGADA
ncbi:unnamed protein product [Pedinophyceae sp. YPF-701]|nr:unnamed protein product [Pedinophyceae sp. YPF-701]